MRLRPLSVIAGCALAATTLVAVPSPAQAVGANGTAQTGRQVNEIGPATCNVTNPASNTSGPFTSNGVTVNQTASGTTTLVDTGDAGDTTSFATSATTKVRSTEAAGQVRTIDVDATFTGTVTAAQGAASDCDSQATLTSVIGYQTTLSSARWVRVDATIPSNTTLQVFFQRTSPASPPAVSVITLAGNSKGHQEAEVFLPAGTYTAQHILATAWTTPQVASDPTSFNFTPHVHVVFQAAGSAKDKALGDGAAYAKLKDARDCTANQLKGKFLKAAGTKTEPTLKKAIFKVNGVKSKVVKKAAKGGKITLKNLPSDQDVLVKAIFKLVDGGSETFTREYFSCT